MVVDWFTLFTVVLSRSLMPVADALERRLVMFTGKGGVGKTTCSAATAIRLAETGKRVLLVSSDFQPSLSDILEVNVRRTPREVLPGLKAVELDEEEVIRLWKERYGEEVYQVVSSFLPVGKEIIDYVAGAPGLADEFMLAYMLDAYRSDEYDCIVWDTAPAGGTLRLIKLEEQLYSHMGDAAQLYLRIKGTLEKIRRGGRSPLEIIEEWRKLALDVLSMLRSPDTGAIVVTIPEALSVAQTRRVMSELRDFGLEVIGVIINELIVDDGGCEFLRRRREMQEGYLRELKAEFDPNPGVSVIPLLETEVKGIEALKTVASLLYPTP